jgi:hypothetical protein
MDDNGSKHMAIGGLVFVVGCVVTLVTFSAAQGGGRFLFAWGAILFGAVQFLYGVSQRGSATKERNAPLAALPSDVATLMRALIAASATCGPLNDSRIGVIRQLLKQITNTDLEDSYIADSARALAREGQVIQSHLVRVHAQLTPRFKEVIARASLAVMCAEGPLTEARRDHLLYIIRSMQFHDSVLSQIEREMMPAPGGEAKA